MKPSPTPATIHVDVPAEEGFLRLLRMTTASAVADHVGTLPRLDDVRLAVGELAAGVVAVAEADRMLHMDIRVTHDQLVVHGRVAGSTGSPGLSEVGELLVATVSSDHTLGRDGDDLVFDLGMAIDGAAGGSAR